MEMRILKHNFELFQFQKEFLKRSKNPLGIEFLKGALVFGYFKKGSLVGGYIINSVFPLRYFNWVPVEDQKSVTLLKQFKEGQTSEICCIWMDKSKVSPLDRNLLYFSLAINTILHSNHWVFGGSISEKVAEIQKRVMPKIVYHGSTTLPDSPKGEIYYATKTELFTRTILRFIYETSLVLIQPFVPTLPRKPKRGFGL